MRKLIYIASTFYFMPFHASCSIFITCTGENTGKFNEKNILNRNFQVVKCNGTFQFQLKS